MSEGILKRTVVLISLQAALSSEMQAIDLEPVGFDPISATRVDSASWSGGGALIQEDNRFLGGLSLTAKALVVLDDNINQADGFTTSIQDDLITTLGGKASWKGDFRDVSVGIDLDASYDGYADHDEYSGLDYGIELSSAYKGGALDVKGSFGFSSVQGIERYTGTLSDREVADFRLEAGFALSAKTSLEASLLLSDSQLSSSGGAALQDSSRRELLLGVAWQASPLSRLTLDLRSTGIDTETSGSRSTLGPSISLDYQLTEKIDLDARLGIDFADSSVAGITDSMASGGIGLAYQLDPLWTFKLNFNHDTEAVESRAGGFREYSRFRFGVTRRILDLQLDVGWFREDSDTSGSGAPGSGESLAYEGYDASLSYPLFGGNGKAALFVRCQNNDSNLPGRNWDGNQTGLSLIRNF